MAGAVDILVEIAPELASETPTRLDLFLELAASRISPEVFGRVYVQAVAYLAAHLLTLANRAQDVGTAAPGAVQSASTGGVSVAFGSTGAPLSVSDAALGQTNYGLQYLELRNSRAATKMRLIRP